MSLVKNFLEGLILVVVGIIVIDFIEQIGVLTEKTAFISAFIWVIGSAIIWFSPGIQDCIREIHSRFLREPIIYQ